MSIGYPAGCTDLDLPGAVISGEPMCTECELEGGILNYWGVCTDCVRLAAEMEAACQGECKEIDTETGRCLDCDAQIVDARPTACIALTSVLPRSPVVCGGKDQERFKVRRDHISAEDFAAGRFTHWTLCKECLRITRGDA